MSKDNSFVQYVTGDLLREMGGVTARAMFGGYGVYKDGIFFAIIDNDQLYFKVDATNVKEYQEHGSQQFEYQSPKGPMPMAYWLVPDDVMENPRLAVEWADKSYQISLRAKKLKPKKTSPKKRTAKTKKR